MFDNIIDRNAISKIQCPDRIGIDFVDKFIRDNSKRDYCMLSTSKLQSGYGVYIINYLTKDGEDSDREMIRVTTHIEAGNIVISVGLFGHSGDKEVWEGMDEGTFSKTKEMLDDMHKRKIDMADSIYVINVGGYIGESTRSEIEYAKAHGKEVHYLEE